MNARQANGGEVFGRGNGKQKTRMEFRPKQKTGIRKGNMEDLTRSANKFSILEERTDTEVQEIQDKNEKDIADKYVKNQRQPTLEELKSWSKEMFNYFKDQWEAMWNKEDDECEDVYEGIIDSKPWVLMGDWNVSLSAEDHSEGGSCKTNDMLEFQECVDQIEVEDINCSRIHFTWVQSRLNPGSEILKKSARSNGNHLNSHAVFLPHLTSDHSPSMLIIPKVLKSKHRAFRFPDNIKDKPEFAKIVGVASNSATRATKHRLFWDTNMGFMHQELIEILSYAMVITKNHIFTSGASGTNAAVIRSALRAERSDLLTIILPQSLEKQPILRWLVMMGRKSNVSIR
ncbi:hypothetical protein CTI12_AA110470 [Artemisia annua]|uniref:RNA-directed DNA polymerase, eukaryota, Reverse transcriptase zinc-binding domain protein n=1 Tax=Artemisia annua TaxID=35608 RepID=A0A2U1PV83_ARTAN|nr:hypothetical protein CTI12_AA110470 [Artemisia annua]